jgi:hypothetical protein
VRPIGVRLGRKDLGFRPVIGGAVERAVAAVRDPSGE